jgi:hypothetical protein
MLAKFHAPEHYREKARQLRLSAQIHSGEAREHLNRLADEYDRLAERSQQLSEWEPEQPSRN